MPTARLHRTACHLLAALAAVTARGEEAVFHPARSYSTRPDPDPPAYVRPNSVDPEGKIDFGLDYRWRFEAHDDDLRRPAAGMDAPQLHRIRAYFGLKQALDPLRFAFEVQDSRKSAGDYPVDGRDVNEAEFIRAYVELRGPGESGLRYGIHNFEFLDRRLIGNNQWRNTANTFDGLHGYAEGRAGGWRIDALSVRPLERIPDARDRPVAGQRMHALIGRLSPSASSVIQPYWLRLDDDATPGRRRVDSPGIRVYGDIVGTDWDYDCSATVQTGRSGPLSVRAHAFTAEAGWRARDPWDSRVGLFVGYATGDGDAADGVAGRFEKFFGFGRPWSASDYVVNENIITPKLRWEARPSEVLRFDVGWSSYWLQSANDRFYGAALIDPAGASGTHLGDEIDFRIRWTPNQKVQVILGYSHFLCGEFVRAQTGRQDTDFAYLEVQLTAF
jgi:hypothetical protein